MSKVVLNNLNNEYIEDNYIKKLYITNTGDVNENFNLNVLNNFSDNINIFNRLIVIKNETSEKVKKIYNKLINSMKRALLKYNNSTIDGKLSDITSYIDEDNEIQLEWIINSNYRINFYIENSGKLYIWKFLKDGEREISISDTVLENEISNKIEDMINEVMNLECVI